MNEIVVVTGPTAAGKTEVAVELQAQLGGPSAASLISIDSAMIYRGMDIGTAKPDVATLAAHPHELIDILDPAEAYSAADFVRDADEAVRVALASGRVPILVGGTMLYLRCFREGIADLPDADHALRGSLEAELAARGPAALHAELAAIDPQAAANIHPHNRQRLLRALEVIRLTGASLSSQWRDQRDCAERVGAGLRTFVLDRIERSVLHERIERRLSAMLKQGFLDEVAALRERSDLDLRRPSMRAVGYRQAWRHLAGQLTLGEFRDQALAATRQLAKRQTTWLRSWHGQWSDIESLDPRAPDALAASIIERISDLPGARS